MSDFLNERVLYDQVMFVGQTLGLFYLEDPLKGEGGPAFEAIKDLDPEKAAEDWPFVKKSAAFASLTEMQEGLAEGIDSEDLVWAYRRLFIGPALKPAPPWGSVYTDRDGVVFGKSTLDLNTWMKNKGIQRLQDEKTPEDHIGLMLLQMGWIAGNRPELLEEFLRLHLLTWSSHFLDQLVAATTQPFYRGLAGLTKASLEGIQGELGIVVEYPKYYR